MMSIRDVWSLEVGEAVPHLTPGPYPGHQTLAMFGVVLRARLSPALRSLLGPPEDLKQVILVLQKSRSILGLRSCSEATCLRTPPDGTTAVTS